MRGPEAKIQDSFLRWAKSKGFKVIKYNASGFGSTGIPDAILLANGLWILCEFKATKNSKKRPGQQEWIDFAQENSFGYFIYKENVEQIKKEIEALL